MLSAVISLWNRDRGPFCLVNIADFVGEMYESDELMNSEETIHPQFQFQTLIVETNFDQLLSFTNGIFNIQVSHTDNFKASGKKLQLYSSSWSNSFE